jgi:hypothetical protein
LLTADTLSKYIISTSELSDGFDTIASFTAKHAPAALALMDDPLTGFEGDEEQLRQESERLGLPVHSVAAAPFFAEKGIDHQPAFQTGLIAALFRG